MKTDWDRVHRLLKKYNDKNALPESTVREVSDNSQKDTENSMTLFDKILCVVIIFACLHMANYVLGIIPAWR